MGKIFSVGDTVKWKWGNGYGEGKIAERFNERVTRTLDGAEVTRDASSDNPAYLIEQDDGSRVLKSDSEIEKAS